MKRTSIVLDEKLVQEALELTGERTASAVVNKSLAELVDRAKREKKKSLAEYLRETPGVFRPGYLEEIRPNAWTLQERQEAAREVRAPGKAKKRGHRSR